MIATDPVHLIAHLTVEEVMHSGVIGVEPQATLAEVAAAMAYHHVHCVIVEGVTVSPRGGEHLVWGAITSLDLVRALEAGGDADAGRLAVEEVLTVDVGQTLDEVVQMMAEHDATHVVAVRDGIPAGVVSTLDIARAVAG